MHLQKAYLRSFCHIHTLLHMDCMGISKQKNKFQFDKKKHILVWERTHSKKANYWNPLFISFVWTMHEVYCFFGMLNTKSLMESATLLCIITIVYRALQTDNSCKSRLLQKLQNCWLSICITGRYVLAICLRLPGRLYCFLELSLCDHLWLCPYCESKVKANSGSQKYWLLGIFVGSHSEKF